MQVIVIGSDKGQDYLALVEFCATRGIKLVEEKYVAAMDAEAQAEQEAYAAQCEAEAEQENAEQNQTAHNSKSMPCLHRHQDLSDGPYHVCKDCGMEVPQ